MKRLLFTAWLPALLMAPGVLIAQSDRGDNSERDRELDRGRYSERVDQQSERRDERGERHEERGQRRSQRQGNREQARQKSQENQARRIIERFDENGDGALQFNELPNRLRDSFARLDQDGDEQIAASELIQHASRMRITGLARNRVVPMEIIYVWISDADNGRLSVDELQDAYNTLQELDKDGDGKITRDEVQQRRKDVAEKWARTVIDRLDDDGDDEVSREEAEKSFLARRFEEVDKDGNNSIVQSELQECLKELSDGQPRGRQERAARRADEDRGR